ncbi:DUF1905 domain-containing protein [Erythrobacter sp. GH1-10]|uniref:DUF1905 domain-containing protein n=1 Tax=Erythrobacter sp. GH1-10 TaxID=3349334 RepID=UPI003877C5CB
MSETLSTILPLKRWQGEKAVYHLVAFTGAEAEAIAAHAMMHRLEFGRQRGFGSVKVIARIGATEWTTSVFPQRKQSEWVLLVSKKVMRAEGIAPGDSIPVSLTI